MRAVRLVICRRGRLQEALQFRTLSLLPFDLIFQQCYLSGQLPIGVMSLSAFAFESRMPRSTTAWFIASVSVAFSAISPIQMNKRLIALNIGFLVYGFLGGSSSSNNIFR
jgi:hypothetical protein